MPIVCFVFAILLSYCSSFLVQVFVSASFFRVGPLSMANIKGKNKSILNQFEGKKTIWTRTLGMRCLMILGPLTPHLQYHGL